MAASRDHASAVFKSAVERVLSSWTVLQLAVQHGFGGRDSQAKAQWLPEAIGTWFSENADIQPDELEDFLSDILDTEFTTIADDGSLPEIAGKICGYWRLCEAGNEAALANDLQSLPKADTSCSQRHETSPDSSDDDDDDQEPPRAVSIQQPSNPTQSADRDETAMEEDGWTVVQKPKRR